MSTPSARTPGGLAFLLVVVGALASASVASGQNRPYRPKNGVLNLKAVLFGGGFRVTPAIPLHGDFSAFTGVEVVQPTSVIGPDVPAQVLRRIGEALTAEFERGQRFSDVRLVEGWVPPEGPEVNDDAVIDIDLRQTDPLDAPLRPAEDLVAFDRRRLAQQSESRRATHTLIVRIHERQWVASTALPRPRQLRVDPAGLVL